MTRLLATLVLLAAQDDRDTDPAKLPGEAEKYYRLALYDEAEKDLRAQVAKSPNDKARAGLLQVLVRARRHDDVVKEAAALFAETKDEQVKVLALVAQAQAFWKKGEIDAAKQAAEHAVQVADLKGANALPDLRRWAATTIAFLPWKRVEGKRVEVWTAPDGKSDARALAARLDKAAEAMMKALGVTMAERVEVYVFDDQRQADAVLATPLNFAVPRDGAIYVLADAAMGHELAHVVCFRIANRRLKERPRCSFLIEGTAAAFSQEPLWERRIAEVPRDLSRRGKLRGLAEFAKETGGGADFTACAGSFVKMICEKHGRDVFLRLWAEFNDHEDPWSAVIGRTLAELAADWSSYVGG